MVELYTELKNQFLGIADRDGKIPSPIEPEDITGIAAQFVSSKALSNEQTNRIAEDMYNQTRYSSIEASNIEPDKPITPTSGKGASNTASIT